MEKTPFEMLAHVSAKIDSLKSETGHFADLFQKLSSGGSVEAKHVPKINLYDAKAAGLNVREFLGGDGADLEFEGFLQSLESQDIKRMSQAIDHSIKILKNCLKLIQAQNALAKNVVAPDIKKIIREVCRQDKDYVETNLHLVSLLNEERTEGFAAEISDITTSFRSVAKGRALGAFAGRGQNKLIEEIYFLRMNAVELELGYVRNQLEIVKAGLSFSAQVEIAKAAGFENPTLTTDVMDAHHGDIKSTLSEQSEVLFDIETFVMDLFARSGNPDSGRDYVPTHYAPVSINQMRQYIIT